VVEEQPHVWHGLDAGVAGLVVAAHGAGKGAPALVPQKLLL